MVHPTPNGLVGHRHSALRQQILDVTQAEGEPEVEPYCLVNDLGRETIPGVADLVHPRWATRPPRTPQAQSAVTMPERIHLCVSQLNLREDSAGAEILHDVIHTWIAREAKLGTRRQLPHSAGSIE